MPYVVGSAEVELVPSAQGFDERADALLHDLRLNVILDPDIEKLRADLATLRDLHVAVDADLHDATTRAELDELTRPRVVEVVTEDIGGGKGGSKTGDKGGDAAGGLAAVGNAFSAIGSGLRTAGITELVALVPALVPLAAGLSGVALGLGAVVGAAGLGAVALGGVTIAAIATDQQLRSQLTPSLDALKKSLDTLVSANQASILAPLQAGIHLLTSALPELSPLLASTGDAVMKLLEPLQKAVTDGTFQKFIADIAPMAGSSLTGIGTIFENITVGVGKMLAAFGPTGVQIINNWVTATSHFADLGSSAGFNAFVSYVLENLPAATDFMHELGSAVADIVRDFAPLGAAILPLVTQLLQTLVPIIGSLVTVISPLLTAIVPLASALLGNATALGTFHTAILNLTAQMPTIAATIVNVVKGIIGSLPTVLPAVLQAALTIVIDLGRALAAYLPTMIPTLVSALTSALLTLVQMLPVLLTVALQLIQGLATGFLNALPILIAALPPIIQGVVTFLLEALPLIITTGVQILTALVNDMPEIIAAIVAALPQIIDAIDNALIVSEPIIIKAGVLLLTSLVTQIPTIVDVIVRSLPPIIDGIVKYFTSPSGIRQMERAGEELINGLTKGFTDAIPGLLGAVTHSANSIINDVKHLFGINSPSKVFEEIGMYNGQGLQIGMTASIDTAMTAADTQLRKGMQGLTATATAGLAMQITGPTLGSTSTGTSDILTQLAVLLKAILDKTATAQDIARANRLLARTGATL